MALTDEQEKALRDEHAKTKTQLDEMSAKLGTLEKKTPTPANNEIKSDLADHMARLNERMVKIEEKLGVGKKEPSGYFFEE